MSCCLLLWGGQVGQLEKVTFVQTAGRGKGVGLGDPEGRAFQAEEQPVQRPLFKFMFPPLSSHSFHSLMCPLAEFKSEREEVVRLAACPAISGAPWSKDPTMVSFIVTPYLTLACPDTHTPRPTYPDIHTHTCTETHTLWPIERPQLLSTERNRMRVNNN